MRATNTYKHTTGRTTSYLCACGRRFTSVTMLVCEKKRRGTGAYAVAQRLDRGESLEDLRDDPQEE